MLGNIWRFDFQPAPLGHAASARRATRAANAQPITIRPELAELDGKPFVMVGTGKLLGASDVTDPQVQSVYGLRDPLDGPGPIYPDPIARLAAADGRCQQAGRGAAAVRTIVCTGAAAECGRHRRLGARPGRGRRARQRRDEAGPRRAGLRQQRPGGDARARSAATAGSTRSTSASARRSRTRCRRSTCPTRSTSASTSCSSQPANGRQSDLHRQLPPERCEERQEGPASARAASGRQAHQLAGDRRSRAMISSAALGRDDGKSRRLSGPGPLRPSPGAAPVGGDRDRGRPASGRAGVSPGCFGQRASRRARHR